MTAPLRRREGIALLLALIALAIVSLVAIGAIHLSLGDARRVRDAALPSMAAGAADYAAYAPLTLWTPSLETLSVGDTVGYGPITLARATTHSTTVRLTPTLFWTVGSAAVGDSAAGTLTHRSANVLYRLAIPDVPVLAALTVRDSVTVSSNAALVGADTSTGTWARGCTAAAPGAGLAASDTTHVCDGGCGGGPSTRIQGVPARSQDSSAAGIGRYSGFGHESWTSWTARATVTITPGASVTPTYSLTGTQCNLADPANWGDPTGASACAWHAPVIWARGDVELQGGVGQGVLLVDGDLTLSGGVQFTGLIIVRDDIVTAGIGGRVFGAALAGDNRGGAGDHTLLSGWSEIRLSRCAVEGVIRRSAPLRTVVGRSWAAIR